MKQFFSFLLCIVFGTSGFAQRAASNDYFISVSQNGLNSLCAYMPQLPLAQVSVTIRAGAIYERVEQKGLSNLLCEIVSNRIRKDLTKGIYSNIVFDAETGIENTVFKFKTPHGSLQQTLDFISNHLVGLKISSFEIDEAIQLSYLKQNEFETSRKDAYKRILQSQLFKFDLDKVNIWGDTATLANYTVLDVDSFYRLYYSPVASTVAIQSNYQPFTQLNMLEKSFGKWLKIDFNPDDFTKIRSIKPLIYSTQNTVFTENALPKITLSTLYFGTRNYTRGSYYAFLLSAMLNDSTQQVFNALKEEAGIKKIQVNYEGNNYYGVFSISVFPEEGKHRAAYDLLQKSIKEIYRFIDDKSVAKAKQKFEKEYQLFKDTPSFFNESAKHFFSNATDYFEILNDSVQAISTSLFLRNTYTSFCNANFVAIAEIDSAHYTSENYNDWFAEIDEHIANEQFTYQRNVYKVEGEANKQLLNRLIQWLKVNPDMQCQINGRADKRKEYNQFKDEGVWAFIDTLATFQKYKPDLLKTGIMRPELLRSLFILKTLAENGIAIERLSGTSIPLTSKNEEQEEENRTASITLTRLKNRLPLRDIRIWGK